MTLRAGHEIDTLPEEEKKDKKEEKQSSNNSKVVVSESLPPKGDVTLPPTCVKELLTAPRVLRAPFPACLTSPSSFDRKGVIKEDILEVFKQVKINLPLLDVIKQIPTYAKFLKNLCTQKCKDRLKSQLLRKVFSTE